MERWKSHMRRHIHRVFIQLLVIVMVLPALSAGASAADATVTLNPIANKQTGDRVVIAGTTALQEVTVKVLRPNETLLYVNVLQGPAFSDAFILPAAAAEGTYTVIVGREQDTAVQSFHVAKRPAATQSWSGGGYNNSSAQSGMEKPEVVRMDGKVKVVIPSVKANEAGMMNVQVDAAVLQAGLDLAAPDSKGVRTIEVQLPEEQGAKGHVITLPAEFIAAASLAHRIQVSTSEGTVTLPGNMFRSGDLERYAGSALPLQISLSIRKMNPVGLTASPAAEIGNRPVISLAMSVDGRDIPWNNPFAPVTVSIPYQPSAVELQAVEHITVWHIDSNGHTRPVTSGKYNPEHGAVQFRVTHFSSFAVVFVQKTFADLASSPWAAKAIEVMASKGVINGMSSTAYHPKEAITRADFIQLLVTTLGLAADAPKPFADVPSTAYYYEAVGIARTLGITTGTGSNAFKPKEFITRQEMMTLIFRAMDAADKPLAAGMEQDLSAFGDSAEIAPYARDSVAALVKSGLVQGTGEAIHPLANATRAETAVLIYRLYNK
ncbi:hypothetical protein EBB07_16710 [Paenibacillaceae bacterium]|nr:hypothetical protein EBB07_16710 [Paenibacillaceae bacterium]